MSVRSNTECIELLPRIDWPQGVIYKIRQNVKL